jgi:hypothetical protein
VICSSTSKFAAYKIENDTRRSLYKTVEAPYLSHSYFSAFFGCSNSYAPKRKFDAVEKPGCRVMRHDSVRAVVTEKDSPKMFAERLIAVAGFAFAGMALLLVAVAI